VTPEKSRSFHVIIRRTVAVVTRRVRVRIVTNSSIQLVLIVVIPFVRGEINMRRWWWLHANVRSVGVMVRGGGNVGKALRGVRIRVEGVRGRSELGIVTVVRRNGVVWMEGVLSVGERGVGSVIANEL